MTMQRSQVSRSRQGGFSLIEAVLSLALIGLIGLGIAQMANSDRQELTLASVASRMAEVRTAADRHIRDNFSTLETAATAGPVAIPVSTLISGNYLPPNYSNTNEYQQVHRVYVRRRAAGVLESLVVTTGGRSLSQFEGGKVSALLKGSGGFVPVGSANAVGTKGGWTAPLSTFVPSGQPRPSGHPAAYSLIRKFEGPSGALMRDNTGNPADNRMNTNLDMAGNDILNVRNLKVGSTTINQTTVQNISDLASVSCASGQVLTKVGASIMCVTPASGMPSGGVAAFRSGCPSGWSPLSAAAGRVLVGVGGGYTAGQTGGNNTVTLTQDQMPAHSHKIMTSGTRYDWEVREGYGLNGTVRTWSETGGDTEYSVNTTDQEANIGNSSTVGGGQPLDIRQPFYAIHFCEKN